MNIFAEASKLKLLFNTSKGKVSLQDLWDLPMNKLRNMANELNRGLTKPEDLFAVTTTDESSDKLRLAVIMEIIDVRQSEAATKLNEKEREQKRKLIKSLIEQKKLEATSQMSVADLEKLLAET
jgi:hypothetical protein